MDGTKALQRQVKRYSRIQGNEIIGLKNRAVALFLVGSLWVISCKKSSDQWSWDGSLSALDPRTVTKKNSQKVYVHYMPWFDTPETTPEGTWGLHWTMANKNPDIIQSNGRRQIASYFYPLIGPYASSDPDVIDYHTLLMKYAGIDGVIVDWYGSHELFDYPLTRRNTDSLFSHIPKAGLKFSICYEDITLQRVNTSLGKDIIRAAQQDLSYLQSHYFGSPDYIRINNQRLLLCFGPQVLTTEAGWKQAFSVLDAKPLLLSLWNLGDVPGNQGSGEYTWVYKDNIDCQYFYQYRAPALANAFGCAFPGFKDFYAEGGWGASSFVREHNGTTTLQSTLDLAGTSNLSNIQLITWNDFGEGTMIEPTVDFSFSFLETIQRYTGVPYTRSELELVYKWYTLRKKYPGNKATQNLLLQAYYFLVSLDVAKAKTLMSAID